MIGNTLYVFKCGCTSYVLEKKYQRSWVCPKHKKTIEVVHSFCILCGLDMQSRSLGKPKLYCEHETTVIGRYGKPQKVNGCRYIQSRQIMRDYYREKVKPFKPFVPKPDPKPVRQIDWPDYGESMNNVQQTIKRSVAPLQKIKTPMLDELSYGHDNR